MKVIKFGGSSVASSGQIRKIFEIIKSDKDRRIVVVSAPGKRFSDDSKVTDLLIAYFTAYKNGQPVENLQEQLLERFKEISQELDILDIYLELEEKIMELAQLPLDNKLTYDQFLSTGEECSARLIAAFFKTKGLATRFISPKEAGILVSGKSCQAQLLPEANEKISRIIDLAQEEILIVPGFFGMTQKGEVCTFSRGGSDITGAILAAGIKADLYENFTDVDGIYAVNPAIIENPVIIEEVTYREMRELAFAGFSVLHEEALIPAARAGVPMVLKNTNNPSHPGTRIVPEWTIEMPVVGIASSKGFVLVKINKYMLYRDISFGRKFFGILEELGISFEAITTGIDDISILVRQIYLTRQIEKLLAKAIEEILQPDDYQLVKNLSVVTAVSEEIRQQTHITGRATKALGQEGIKIETLMQGASEVSLLFIVDEAVEKAAVIRLYQEFFLK